MRKTKAKTLSREHKAAIGEGSARPGAAASRRHDGRRAKGSADCPQS